LEGFNEEPPFSIRALPVTTGSRRLLYFIRKPLRPPAMREIEKRGRIRYSMGILTTGVYMRKGRSFFFIILLVELVFALQAQEEDEPREPPIESDWSGYMPSLYTKGDQTFILSLGPIFPTLFWNDSGTLDNKINPGGTGFLAYNYFLTPNFYIGGELGGMFSGTVGQNMIFIIPIGFRAGYQFILGRIEIPLTLMIGVVPQKYLDEGYFGLIVKPTASVFWRFNPDWSFGINGGWWWVPQWTKKSDENAYGNFLEVTLAVRYHF
jgi:hypothetical protein